MIVSVLTWIIAVIVAVATWQLILHTVAMIRSRLLDPRDSQAFQSVFGMVLTLLITLEFKHSLMVVLHHQRNVPVRHPNRLARRHSKIYCSGSLSNRTFHRRSARGRRTCSWYCVLACAQPGIPRRDGRKTEDESSELIAKAYGGSMLDGTEGGQSASITDG
jgi:hypothetical protein